MDQNCIFCRIVKGEIPCYKIWEDDKALAFLSVDPHTPGHTLVIPKSHTDYMFDLEDDLMAHLFVSAKKISKALKLAFSPQSGKIGLLVIGLQVPHAHIHLVPLSNEKDINMGIERPKVLPEEFLTNLQKIKSQL